MPKATPLDTLEMLRILIRHYISFVIEVRVGDEFLQLGAYMEAFTTLENKMLT